MTSRSAIGIFMMPIGFALLTIGIVFSENLGLYKYVILIAAIISLASSVLLLLFSALKADISNPENDD